MPARAVPSSLAFGAETRPGLLTRWLATLKAAARRTDAAHARRCTLENVPAHMMRDIGLTPEDATGISRFQPDLPFFMQSGFGDR